MNKTMPFSWKALILAPLAIPFCFSALLSIGGAAAGKVSFISFVILMALSCSVSYGCTVFLLMPSLFLLSQVARVTCFRTVIVGALLGAFIYIPYVLIMYNSSGPDSGPPTLTLGAFLQKFQIGWDFWVTVALGTITALLYWFLAQTHPKESAAGPA